MIVSLRAFEKVKLYKAFITLLEGAEVERLPARPVAFPKSLKRRKTRLASLRIRQSGTGPVSHRLTKGARYEFFKNRQFGIGDRS
jgi:hypothetical protein